MRDYKQEYQQKLAKVRQGICQSCTKPVGSLSKWRCDPCDMRQNERKRQRLAVLRATIPARSEHANQPRNNGKFIAGTLFCAQGHEYTAENILWHKRRGKPPRRECRECNRLRMEIRRNGGVEIIHRRMVDCRA